MDAHRDSVDSVKEAGKKVLATEHGGDTPIKRKLGDVNELWEKVQKKSANKFKQMKDALREAKSFTGELQDLLLHLSDLEGNLISSTQIGGLPETAKEQLERFMVSWPKFWPEFPNLMSQNINICDNFMNTYKYRINKI